jgi:coenzyme PQQ precursor peptide PqqA
LTQIAACGRFTPNLGHPAPGGSLRSGTVGWIAGLYFMRINPVEDCMKDWHKPEVVEQDVGMEVTSYLPAELDA